MEKTKKKTPGFWLSARIVTTVNIWSNQQYARQSAHHFASTARGSRNIIERPVVAVQSLFRLLHSFFQLLHLLVNVYTFWAMRLYFPLRLKRKLQKINLLIQLKLLVKLTIALSEDKVCIGKGGGSKKSKTKWNFIKGGPSVIF